MLHVVDKGKRAREVPMPAEVMAALAEYLGHGGLPADPKACSEATHLIGKLNNGIGPQAARIASEGLTAGALYGVLKAFFEAVAAAAPKAEEAKRFRRSKF